MEILVKTIYQAASPKQKANLEHLNDWLSRIERRKKNGKPLGPRDLLFLKHAEQILSDVYDVINLPGTVTTVDEVRL